METLANENRRPQRLTIELQSWHVHVVYELTDRTYVLGDTLAITAIRTEVTLWRLLLMRIEDHKRLTIENLMELQLKT